MALKITALEEFGKLLLVMESKSNNNQCEIKREWFRTHIALTEGDFVISHFYWRDFVVGLADFEARLSIFYTDFKNKGKNDIDMVKVPNVNKNMLQNAIDELEKAVKEL